MWYVLGFCAISPIRKRKQLLRMSLTFNNFNTFLVGIDIFKVKKNKKKHWNKVWNMFEINNKDTRTTSIRYLYF